jgi:hypothetical protein
LGNRQQQAVTARYPCIHIGLRVNGQDEQSIGGFGDCTIFINRTFFIDQLTLENCGGLMAFVTYVGPMGTRAETTERCALTAQGFAWNSGTIGRPCRTATDSVLLGRRFIP